MRAAAMLELSTIDRPVSASQRQPARFSRGSTGLVPDADRRAAEFDGGSCALAARFSRPDGSAALTDDRTVAIEDGATLGAAIARDLCARAGAGFFDWH